MTAAAQFLSALESELRLLGQSFSRAALQEFVADVWALAQHDPDADRWTRAFLESVHRESRERAQAVAEVLAIANPGMTRLQWGQGGATIGILDWLDRVQKRRRERGD